MKIRSNNFIQQMALYAKFDIYTSRWMRSAEPPFTPFHPPKTATQKYVFSLLPILPFINPFYFPPSLGALYSFSLSFFLSFSRFYIRVVVSSLGEFRKISRYFSLLYPVVCYRHDVFPARWLSHFFSELEHFRKSYFIPRIFFNSFYIGFCAILGVLDSDDFSSCLKKLLNFIQT